MDLGFAGATAVVTGGSKGMGLAIAETLGAEGASVAIMTRGQQALELAAERIRNAGAPEVLPISVDMTDAESIAAGYATVNSTWGPAQRADTHRRADRRPLRGTRRRRLARRIRPGRHGGGSLGARRASDAACGRMGPHRHPVRALDSAPERTFGRVHGEQSRAVQLHQESVQEPWTRRHSGQLCVRARS